VLDLNGHTVATAGLSGVAGSEVQFDGGSSLGLDVANGTTQSFAGNLVDTGGFSFVVKVARARSRSAATTRWAASSTSLAGPCRWTAPRP
jgi:hypothetical protein